MSLARTYTTKKVQKDWVCGKCGSPIRKGVDGRISFAVGYRGREQTRCLKPECYPTPSERESSAVSAVYAAQEGIDLSACQTLEDLETARDEVADAAQEVADEYEQNEMFDINEDLQERAQILTDAADALRDWEPEGEEPDEEQDCEDCDGTGQVEVEDADGVTEDCETCEGSGTVDSSDERDAWLQEARESLQAAIDEMELP